MSAQMVNALGGRIETALADGAAMAVADPITQTAAVMVREKMRMSGPPRKLGDAAVDLRRNRTYDSLWAFVHPSGGLSFG